jgi:hypothetical protein
MDAAPKTTPREPVHEHLAPAAAVGPNGVPSAASPPDGGGGRGLRRIVTVLEGIRPYDRAWLSRDIVAGVTLAALAIPEVMGYTKIAGTPVITGLYTICCR